MKKIFIIFVIFSLAACKQTTRTDVIDSLLDSGFTRNQANYYERVEDTYILRIGYLSQITGYLESLKNYIGPGPIVILDLDGSTSFNYHFNEDAMLYDIKCIRNNSAVSSELMYSFKNKQFIIGNNYCEYDEKENDSYIEQFTQRREIVLGKMDEIGMNKKKLNLLGDLNK